MRRATTPTITINVDINLTNYWYRVAEFLAGCDERFATPSDVKSYGLSISGHMVSLVEGGNQNSVTVPDSDTTYTALSNNAIDAAVSAALS